jgi:hypothetical protein
MNNLEKRMLAALKILRDTHGAVAVRAEFENEGLRIDELLRLKEVAMRAGLGLMLKIGGCESVRDLLESRLVGATEIVAPMIESPFALHKFVQAALKSYPAEEHEARFLSCNIETRDAVDAFAQMIAHADIAHLRGIVIERVDYCFSIGLTEQAVDRDDIAATVRQVATLAKTKGLQVTIGGGVSSLSLPFFRSLAADGLLDRFETRKVTFAAAVTLAGDAERALLTALGFELLFLRNKQTFYRHISMADEQRIEHLESRYLQQISGIVA